MSRLRWIPLTLLAIALAACASKHGAAPAHSPHLGTASAPGPRAEVRRHGSDDARAYAPAPAEELGTVYGERHRSDSYETRFERAGHRPDALLSLWYDDFDRLPSPVRDSTVYDPDVAVSVSLVDGSGRVLDAVDLGHRRHAVGMPGQRYEIEVTNHTGLRYEVVASVDGLDVIDGSRASTRKRGYILEPYDTLVIDGWRTHEDEVAAFRFGHIEDSYASRRGSPRNIGVIGVALFAERARWTPHRGRRERARPFDDRFAPPPGW